MDNNKINFTFKQSKINFENKDILDEIRDLKPDMVSYSNLIDYWGEKEFIEISQ